MGTRLSRHGVRGNVVGLFGWDAAFYREIARHGYRSVVANDGLRFFPLYPLVSRFFGASDVVLLAITNFSMLIALALLRRLATDWRGIATANRAVWIFALGPGVTATVMGYAEPLFLVFAIGTALALQRRLFVVAAVLSAGAALTRPVGLLLVVMLMVVAARDRSWKAIGAIVGPFVGAGAYFAWTHTTTGDWLRPLHIQAHANLRGRNVDPVRAVWASLREVAVQHRSGPAIHLLWAAIAVCLCTIAFRRLPLPGSSYAAAIVLLSLTTRNLDSYERYLLAAFPLAIAAASIRLPKFVERIAPYVLGMTVVGYATLSFATIYVP